jgi:hypothetical protein
VRIKGEQQGRAKPLFVQLALEPIWKVCMGVKGGGTGMCGGVGVSGGSTAQAAVEA